MSAATTTLKWVALRRYRQRVSYLSALCGTSRGYDGGLRCSSVVSNGANRRDILFPVSSLSNLCNLQPSSALLPSQCHRYMRITTQTVDDAQVSNTKYNLAMSALKNAEQVKKAHEERLLREQYDAMNKQRQKTQQREQRRKTNPKLQKLYEASDIDEKEETRDRAAGVAVVRTIVKQSQPNANIQVDQWTNDNFIGNDRQKNAEVDENSERQWRLLAHKYMEEAALRYGHPLALVRLGNEALERSKRESATPSIHLIDGDRCKEWDDESPINLSKLLSLNFTTHGNIEGYRQLARGLYEEAGKRGSSEGWFNLGHLLWDIFNTNTVNGKAASDSHGHEAMEAFYNAIELGDADAMYFVAAQYLSFGDGEEEGKRDSFFETFFKGLDPELIASFSSTQQRPELDSELHQHGYQLLCHAANNHNHGPALHHLALLNHQLNEDDEEFLQLLTSAADTGHPESLFLQGHCFYNGSDGYNKDVQSALENFLAAADNGHVDAMVSAGAILHQGAVDVDGVVIIQRDQRHAFELYQQAGELGSVEGWRNVVACYASGEGVPQCMDTAKYIAKTMLKDD
jgi:hypothetical protein